MEKEQKENGKVLTSRTTDIIVQVTCTSTTGQTSGAASFTRVAAEREIVGTEFLGDEGESAGERDVACFDGNVSCEDLSGGDADECCEEERKCRGQHDGGFLDG
jgi:hypothetical protein